MSQDRSPSGREEERANRLRELGAAESLLAELLAYTASPYRQLELPPGGLPLAEEDQVASWKELAEPARKGELLAALVRRFPQFRFPIEFGISGTEAYRAATRRGLFDRVAGAVAIPLEAPAEIEFRLAELPAGTIPVLVAATRQDFVALVRALACRNEPEEVPDSMGACLVRGLPDWSRLDRLRSEFSSRLGREASPEEWSEELARLGDRKERWQARLILLSRGPYSAVTAAELELEPAPWLRDSLEIRLAHEGLHYLTLRLWGRIRSNLLDELVADAAGMVQACGEYRPDWAKRFLGLRPDGSLLPGARLAIYRGEPPLSEASVEILGRLAVVAVESLARALSGLPRATVAPSRQAELWMTVLRHDLEDFLDDSLERAVRAAMG